MDVLRHSHWILLRELSQEGTEPLLPGHVDLLDRLDVVVDRLGERSRVDQVTFGTTELEFIATSSAQWQGGWRRIAGDTTTHPLNRAIVFAEGQNDSSLVAEASVVLPTLFFSFLYRGVEHAASLTSTPLEEELAQVWSSTLLLHQGAVTGQSAAASPTCAILSRQGVVLRLQADPEVPFSAAPVPMVAVRNAQRRGAAMLTELEAAW